MTESELNDLRRTLIRLTARITSASYVLLVNVEQDKPTIASARELRTALGEYSAWLRKAAGPEDLAALPPRNPAPAPTPLPTPPRPEPAKTGVE